MTTTRRARLGLALLLALAPLHAAWALYKVIGPGGQVTFTDVPPMLGARQVQRLTAQATPAPPPSLPWALRALVARDPVVVYTIADCPACRDGVRLLRARGVPYTELRIDNRTARAHFERLSHGVRRLPLLAVGARQLPAGFDPAAWQRALSAAGYPQRSLLPPRYHFAPARSLAPPAASAASRPAAPPPLPSAPVRPPPNPHAPPGFQF